MALVERFALWLERLLSGVVVLLMVTLTLVIVAAVVYRKLGASFSWYDEVASVMLAWLTYYGSALAALKRAHIGFDGLVLAMPAPLRAFCIILAEVGVIIFFATMAWTGWQVLVILEGMGLVSLPWVPIQLTQSVIPIGAALFILCELLSLPRHWKRLMSGISHEQEELNEQLAEIERQKAEAAARGASHGPDAPVTGRQGS